MRASIAVAVALASAKAGARAAAPGPDPVERIARALAAGDGVEVGRAAIAAPPAAIAGALAGDSARRAAAIAALAHRPDAPAFVPDVVGLVERGAPGARLDGLRALGALAAALTPQARERWEVTGDALDRAWGAVEAIALDGALPDWMRVAAIEALAHLLGARDAPAPDAVLALARDRDREVRLAAVDLIALRAEDPAPGLSAIAAEDADLRVAAQAALALCGLGGAGLGDGARGAAAAAVAPERARVLLQAEGLDREVLADLRDCL